MRNKIWGGGAPTTPSESPSGSPSHVESFSPSHLWLSALRWPGVRNANRGEIRANRFTEKPRKVHNVTRIASNLRFEFLAPRSSICKKGVQFGNLGTIRENQAPSVGRSGRSVKRLACDTLCKVSGPNMHTKSIIDPMVSGSALLGGIRMLAEKSLSSEAACQSIGPSTGSFKTWTGLNHGSLSLTISVSVDSAHS